MLFGEVGGYSGNTGKRNVILSVGKLRKGSVAFFFFFISKIKQQL